MRPQFQYVVKKLEVLSRLSAYDPVLIGTPPLGIQIETSDIDIACCSHDGAEFEKLVTAEFGGQAGFQVRRPILQGHHSIVVKFRAMGWDIELFCQPISTAMQWGVRHFQVEKRLLEICPGLRERVIELKQAGMKTEPAFASALDLLGDPYAAMLDLEQKSDSQLMQLTLENFGASDPGDFGSR
ncbi:DUF4269 domain-containing protein [Stieleria sp. JC731]|uniref:DUF4269 domain-containing protein n=1 Tax=Pirellulaceae TaxID=2691357 RepID=UPI001E4838D0|nr:DUF4269 domain-containing protein [Stieleria sp. JC731]MCC9603712.1 DUF4269 domain-containing protein [Stieleria sp. JC731]